MIKALLRKIFPIAFLKQCFLVYNKIRIYTIDKLLFSEYKVNKDDFRICHQDYPFRINQIDLDPLLGRTEFPYMQHWMDWKQEEFLFEFNGGCWIEPEYGWAIVSPNTLIYQSLAFSRAAHQRKPNLLKFLLRKKISVVDKAISLRDGGEENYFHFYNDVLSKLFFLKQQGIDVNQYTIIVSKKLWDKPYFQYYLKRTDFLESSNWLIQEQEYIFCKTIIFSKPMTHSVSLWNDLLIMDEVNVSLDRKIFLTRSKHRLRFLENSEEIEAKAKRYGLEIIDADALSLEAQMKLFSQASFISGIHGAGLTNMVYRKTPCRVLEIFPPPDLGYLPYHYILLAGIKKFEYRAIVGEAGKISYSGGFYLNPQNFEKELKEFL